MLPKTTILKIKLMYCGHSIPFCDFNELLIGRVEVLVGPLMFYVFGIFEKYKYQIVLCKIWIYLYLFMILNELIFIYAQKGCDKQHNIDSCKVQVPLLEQGGQCRPRPYS